MLVIQVLYLYACVKEAYAYIWLVMFVVEFTLVCLAALLVDAWLYTLFATLLLAFRHSHGFGYF